MALEGDVKAWLSNLKGLGKKEVGDTGKGAKPKKGDTAGGEKATPGGLRKGGRC